MISSSHTRHNHSDKVGDIDLVWGDKAGGFEHILDKHIGDGKSFSTEQEAMDEIERIINEGNIAHSDGDKVVFKSGNKLVTIRKNLREKGKKIADKNWILTAYDESAEDGTGATTRLNKGKAAHATDSDSKYTSSSAIEQEKVEENVEVTGTASSKRS